MKRLASIGLVCCVTALTAFGHDGDRNNNNSNNQNNNQNGANGQFEATLIGSAPGGMIGGVASGGVPWVMRRSEASVSASGQLHLEVNGLLIAAGMNVPANLVGTVGPVQMVAGSLVCGGAGGVVVASTDGVPLSSLGNADIQAQLTMPASCMAPVVLVRIFVASLPIGSQLGPFIAVTGLGPASTSQSQNSNSGHDHD